MCSFCGNIQFPLHYCPKPHQTTVVTQNRKLMKKAKYRHKYEHLYHTRFPEQTFNRSRCTHLNTNVMLGFLHLNNSVSPNISGWILTFKSHVPNRKTASHLGSNIQYLCSYRERSHQKIDPLLTVTHVPQISSDKEVN